ncbi:hypothetical protein J3B02_003149, partial [Coemansia erecta]
MASYYSELGIKEHEDQQQHNQDELSRRPRARWTNAIVDDFMSIGGSNRQTPVGAQASPESYLSVARLFGEFMDNDGSESEHQRFLETLIMQLHEEANSSVTGPPPASKEFIQALPKLGIDESKVEGLSDGDSVTRLPCKHYFHHGCIKPWLELHNTCPMCRFEVPSDDPRWLEKKREETRETIEELKDMM